MQMSFGTLKLLQRLKRDSVLMKIDALIEWEELRPKLTSLYKCELSHGGGQEPFDGLLMFKAILLGQWDAPFLLLPGFNRPVKNYLSCRCGVKNRLKMLIY